MSFKITPTKHRQMKFVTLTWDFGKHPISIGGEFEPFQWLNPPNTDNLVIPKGSVINFAMSETVKTLGASGSVFGLFYKDINPNTGLIANYSPAAIIPNNSGTVGTILVQQWTTTNTIRKVQKNTVLQFYTFGTLDEGIINFTIGFLPGGGHEYLD